jgi:hypothetical protein
MKYPIKYAILELKVNGGPSYYYEEKTKGFIVSKCFVLAEGLKYTSSGKTIPKYIVSFPYDDFEYFIKWMERNRDNYNFDHYSYYYESKNNPDEAYLKDNYPIIVNQIFDTYEATKEIADHKNNELKSNLLTNTGINAYEALSKEFADTMDLCGEYEKFIYANTTDMQVSLLASEEHRIQEAKEKEIMANLVAEFADTPEKQKMMMKELNNNH